MSGVASSISTGGGGYAFEVKVQTSLVAGMLCGNAVPGLPIGTIDKIKLQANDLGYQTDDAVVFLNTTSGSSHRLLCQIKSNITFTKSDDDLSKFIADAWADFNNPSLFDRESDCIALMTGLLSQTDTNEMLTLLDWARHTDAIGYHQKVNVYKAKKIKLDVVRDHLTKAKGSSVSDDELWAFMRSWILLPMDLENTCSAKLNDIFGMLSYSLENPDDAENIWSKLLNYVQGADAAGAQIDPSSIPTDIKQAFASSTISHNAALRRLEEHSDIIRSRISDTIGNVHIYRKNTELEIIDAIQNFSCVIITGETGCGKSALVKNVVELSFNVPVFYFRLEDFNEPHLDATLSKLRVNDRLNRIFSRFALLPEKWIVIESLEKILEFNSTGAFEDLLVFCSKDPSCKLVFSCRSYSLSNIVEQILTSHKLMLQVIKCPLLSDSELDYIREQIPSLKSILETDALRPLLRHPAILEIAFRISKTTQNVIDEKQFREKFWNEVVGKEIDRREGLPDRRKSTFEKLVIARAKAMSIGVCVSDFDPLAISKLEEDSLIIRYQSDLIAPSHDVFEDWVLDMFIDRTYQAKGDKPHEFFSSVGSEPAMRRAFRFWVYRQIGQDVANSSVRDFILECMRSKDISPYLRDEIITAVLMSQEPYHFLNSIKSELLENDATLLKRFCFILRLSCKMPDYEFLNQLGVSQTHDNLFGALLLKPDGNGWKAIFEFILNNLDRFDIKFIPDFVTLLSDYANSRRYFNEPQTAAREAGLIALHLLCFIKDSYHDPNIKRLLVVIFATIHEIDDEFCDLLDADLFGDNRNDMGHYFSYIDEYYKLALASFDGAFLSRHNPDLIIKTAWLAWVADEDTEKNAMYHNLDIHKYFGLRGIHGDIDLFPPSGLKGPFWSLLKFHEDKGLHLILNLCNHVAKSYAKSEMGKSEISMVKLEFPDSTVIEQICSDRLWVAYRNASVVPHIIESALMALENWLIEKLASEEDNSEIIDYILKNSNSVLITAVITGLAAGYWKKLGELCLPLLKVREFLQLDLHRPMLVTAGSMNMHLSQTHDYSREVYFEERKKSDSYEWRRMQLEDVMRNMLFSAYKDQIAKILDDYYSALPPVDKQTEEDIIWKIALGRMDLRKYDVIAVDEEKETFTLSAPEPEISIKEVQLQNEQNIQLTNRLYRLQKWADGKLKDKDSDKEWFSNIHDVFSEAIALEGDDQVQQQEHPNYLYVRGIFHIAAVYIKNYIEELTEDELKWCFDIAKSVIQVGSDDPISYQKPKSPYGESVLVEAFPNLMSLDSAKIDKSDLKRIIAIAITHPDETIRKAISVGLRDYLWKLDPAFTETCFWGSLEYARLVLEIRDEMREPWYPRHQVKKHTQTSPQLEKLRDKIIKERLQFDLRIIDEITLDTHSYLSMMCALRMNFPDSSFSAFIALIRQILNLLIGLESQKNSDKSNLHLYGLGPEFCEMLGEILLSQSLEISNQLLQSLLENISTSPEMTQWVLSYLTYAEDKIQTGETYWAIWEKITNEIIPIANHDAKLAHDNRRFQPFRQVYRYPLFLWINWTGHENDHRLINMGREKIIHFFKQTGNHPIIFESYLKLCFHFAEKFLPDGLTLINRILQENDPATVLSGTNTIYYSERVLQRFISQNISKLRQDVVLRSNILNILDVLIECGSSTAYFLRERAIVSHR